TTLTSVEKVQAGVNTATTFTLDQADLAVVKTVAGSSGSDTLIAGSTAIDLTATTLSSIENLTAGATNNTPFTVTQANLTALAAINGSTATGDTIVTMSTTADLTSTVLTDVEALKAGTTNATTFTLDVADLTNSATNGFAITGSTSNDTLIVKG